MYKHRKRCRKIYIIIVTLVLSIWRGKGWVTELLHLFYFCNFLKQWSKSPDKNICSVPDWNDWIKLEGICRAYYTKRMVEQYGIWEICYNLLSIFYQFRNPIGEFYPASPELEQLEKSWDLVFSVLKKILIIWIKEKGE